jgi:hypothetical protein
LIVVLEFVLRILSVIVGWYKSMTSGQRVRKGSAGVTAGVDDARAQVV